MQLAKVEIVILIFLSAEDLVEDLQFFEDGLIVEALLVVFVVNNALEFALEDFFVLGEGLEEYVFQFFVLDVMVFL